MKFKGVIFDLDGTLVNSLEDIADSMNNVLQRYGFPSHELQAYKYFIGNGIKNLVREALPEMCKEEELILRCFDLMMGEYRNNCTNKTQPYDGIVELLNELAAREMKLAVLSNKVDALTKKVVMTLLPNRNFEVVIGVSDEIPRKPNPLGALLISQQLGIYPENLIYVGDTGVDMQAANSAGAYAVGALWGFRTKEELTLNGAKYLLNHPLELIQMLKEI
ncbi:HAD family hydrolase [Desulfosporosinus sp. Sb-LF]|uniref:HAD family hydrolase n=1 Tax=Desulfosporosinus sp. Sb-LF TaxID=2560027 RepID=UPI00107FA17B|nr:HAD family hydrolase [Desulfosporosinus sp. Sb-LF]TGE31412.1 HAD family hydrolase [Desulfosporosinus sp. Sb-LF]